jgi:5-methylcytosine-specific restriction endonuclease McrA
MKLSNRKRTKKQLLIAENDRLFSLIIRHRDSGKCQKCGAIGTQVHHFFGRGYSVRWDLDNGVLLCFACHIRGAHSRNIKNVIDFMEWAKKYLGKKYDKLLKKSHETVKANITFVREENERLRKEFEKEYGVSYPEWHEMQKLVR